MIDGPTDALYILTFIVDTVQFNKDLIVAIRQMDSNESIGIDVEMKKENPDAAAGLLTTMW